MRRKAVLCAALLAALPALGKYRSEFHQTYGLASNGRVSLDNLNGDVRIFGWDRDEVEVQAVKSAAIGLELAEAQIDVESGDGFVAIRTKYDIHNQADPASVAWTRPMTTVPLIVARVTEANRSRTSSSSE